MDTSVRVIRKRRIEDPSGQQGCALVLLSDDTVQCEFKNGKGKKAFYIPFDHIEREAKEIIGTR